MDVALLSRIQFALTIGFHFLFPPITIGLAWLLVIVEWRAWRRRDPDYENAGKLFGKLLGLTFAFGVATGVVMEFQFGTNWARYSKFVGDIFGAPLAAEAIIAFFLESVFLGVYLFARKRVSRGVHWFSILMVAIGSTISAFWIIVANSWMQTPSGFTFNPETNRAELVSFWAAVFNKSTLIRYFHTVFAAIVCGAFFMAGASAYLLLRGRHAGARHASPSTPNTQGGAGPAPIHAVSLLARKSLAISVVAGLISSVLVAFPLGHHHAKQVAHLQPEKFAAIEGLYSSQTHAPMVMFALPFTEPPRLKAKIEVPGIVSWLAFGDVKAKVKGLDELEAEGRPSPPLWLTFVSFHNMVILGTFFVFAMAYAVWKLRGGRLFTMRKFLWLLLISIPLPLAACQLGWIVAEVGRQPWIVYGVMKTSDAFSTNLSAAHVLFSLILFGSIYLAMGCIYIYMFFHKLRHFEIEQPAAAAAPAIGGPRLATGN